MKLSSLTKHLCFFSLFLFAAAGILRRLNILIGCDCYLVRSTMLCSIFQSVYVRYLKWYHVHFGDLSRLANYFIEFSDGVKNAGARERDVAASNSRDVCVTVGIISAQFNDALKCMRSAHSGRCIAPSGSLVIHSR